MTKWFGTDGIRGRANHTPLTPGFLQKLGRALAEHWGGESGDEVLVGVDGRLSGDMVRMALASGLMSGGLTVRFLGRVTTPCLSFSVKESNEIAGGVMISASHNHYADNGVKCFQSTGEKFTESQEKAVEERLSRGDFPEVDGQLLGTHITDDRLVDSYVDAMRSGVSYDGHVVVDCANGAASGLVERIYRDRVKELSVVHDVPDGMNINEDCGSLHPDVLANEVRDRNADVGFALDGDGDRVVAVDTGGNVINGDVLMFMMASSWVEESGGIVVTVMSNLGLRRALDREDISYDIVGVGDRTVYRNMVEHGWRLGGEQSGHVIDRDWLPTGDGLRTMGSILTILSQSGRSLSEWAGEITVYPQVLHNVKVPSKPDVESLSRAQRTIKDVEEKLGEEGRVLVRYSGTEPVARVMLEGPDEDTISEYAESIGEVLLAEIQERE